ncbi:Gfo/Idh/MocA family oxidoreductase [Paractinoplanes ferrugineus]|uniref:Oxidoreductase n=1 Tax=Paractinoplanes ferrugineus TaxID=113564 RepID=A0A919MF83_9ACTN|nr:Gfo/Idh/MocA family oxidoreductase [Actinoplanes ferrugineus]GIE10305.1 oxidoreductase [Actinoplanes ferrugineus]
MITRIGLLGGAGIAGAAILRPVRRRDDVVVTAVASRSHSEVYASEHGIERAYADYAALLADPEVDLVYNALPPSMHADWTVAALRAGKDVLCEKPFTMNAAQARRVVAAATETGRRVIEAFHDHYHPLSAWVRQAVTEGILGRVHHAEAVFTGANPYAPGTLRHEPELGGGALMDLGCYPVHWLRSIFPGTPTVRTATATRNPAGADMSMRAELTFPGDVAATMTASMADDVTLKSALTLTGERGTLTVDNVVFPSNGHSIRLEVDGVPHVSTVAGRTTYDHQLEAVLAALRTGSPLPTEGDDPVANMAAIDAIYAAAGFARTSWT